MKIIIITLGDIRRPDYGYLIRVSQIIRCIANKHDYRIIQFIFNKNTPREYRDHDNKITTYVVNSEDKVLTGLTIIRGLLSSIKMLRDSDIIMVEGLFFLPFIIIGKLLLRKKIIYDAHSSTIEMARNIRGVKNFILRKLIGGFLEALSTKFADITLVVSDDVAEIFRRYGGDVRIVKHTMDIDKIPFYELKNTRVKRAIFVGNLRVIHNYEAAKTLMKIAEKLNDIEFLVIGEGSEQFMDHPKNVKFLGKVDSLDKYYEEADACVIPLTAGSGIKTKTLECMAYGKPVITTYKGIEGLVGAEKLDGVYVVKDMEEMIDLLRNLTFSRTRFDNLREYVERNYSFKVMCKQLLAVLDELTTRGEVR